MAAGTAAAKEEEDAEMKALEEALQKRREENAAQAAAKAKVPLGASDNGATKDQDITRPRYFMHGTGDAARRTAHVKFLKSVSEMLTRKHYLLGAGLGTTSMVMQPKFILG